MFDIGQGIVEPFFILIGQIGDRIFHQFHFPIGVGGGEAGDEGVGDPIGQRIEDRGPGRQGVVVVHTVALGVAFADRFGVDHFTAAGVDDAKLC